MAYIPLDPELKIKGKAAVDVIGGRGGKSAGSYVQMGLLTVFSGSALYQLVPIIAPIAVGIVGLWILSVFNLSKRFKTLTSEKTPVKEHASVPPLSTAKPATEIG
jgi:AAA family ATP:ADP antiporter